MHKLLAVLLLSVSLFGSPLVSPSSRVALTPEQVREALASLSGQIPFQKSRFTTQAFFRALHAKGPNEEAVPLLPSEFLAIPEADRAHALYPDTACLLAMMISQAAALRWPDVATAQDQMVPVLIRAQTITRGPSILMGGSQLGQHGWVMKGSPITGATAVGRREGPCWPLVEFRQNLPGSDPRIGLDTRTRLVGPDRPSRNFILQHSVDFSADPQLSESYAAGTASELHFATNLTAIHELENWILARILIARAGGSWDPPALRAQFLELAAPRVPAWDPDLAKRFEAAKKNLHPQSAQTSSR